MGHSGENRGDTRLDRHQEHICDLKSDKERECHHDRGERITSVVERVGELQVEVGKESAEIADEDGTHGEDGINQ